jgi:hypothetical protein
MRDFQLNSAELLLLFDTHEFATIVAIPQTGGTINRAEVDCDRATTKPQYTMVTEAEAANAANGRILLEYKRFYVPLCQLPTN